MIYLIGTDGEKAISSGVTKKQMENEDATNQTQGSEFSLGNATDEEIIAEITKIAQGLSKYGLIRLYYLAKHIQKKDDIAKQPCKK